jgi:hypothetical protein
VKLAETLARSQSRSASLSVGTKDEISVRPLSFPTTKVEPYEERLEEMNGAIAQLRDQYVLSQKASEQHHNEVLTACAEKVGRATFRKKIIINASHG